MRILQLLPELNVGGVETGVVDLAKELKHRGHTPIIVSHGGALVEELRRHDIQHVTLPVHRKSPLNVWRLIGQVAQLIRDERIEIVHARSRVPGLIGYFACRRTGAVFVTTCHGYYRPGWASRVMGWGKYVIVPSQVVGRHMAQRFDVPIERIRVIPRGVALRQFAYRAPVERPQQEWTVGIIGRLTPLKGHAVFLRAMARLARTAPRLRLLIVGDAPESKTAYRRELEGLVRQLGLTPHVEWLGTRHDIPAVLARLDALVMASTYPESFGRAVIEAQAAGVPVVATQVGGLLEIVQDRVTGLLVPPGDPVALANAVGEILHQPALAQQLSAAARKRVETAYTLDQMVDATLRVYQDALEVTRLLVMKLSAIGDVVLISPSLQALREKFPRAYLVGLVGPEARPLLQRCPHLNEVLLCHRRGRDRGLRGLLRLAHVLRPYRFDASIDLQNNRTTHLLAFLSGIPHRYGFANGKGSRLLNHRAARPTEPLPPVEHQARLLALLDVRPDPSGLACWTSEEDAAAVESLLQRQWLSAHQRLVGLHPGGSRAWRTKSWDVKSWAELCDALGRERIRVVLTGTRDEEPLGRELAKRSHAQPILAMGKTSLPEFAALVKRCQAIVTLDTAALHIASAVGTPCVALFGPTDPRRHLPSDATVTPLWKQVACSPCYRRRCPLPFKQHLQCMTKITVEDVLTALRPFLREPMEQVPTVVSTEPGA
ncbi:MAG: lipopolysaccharide heptosyltransferase II [Candidatus Omnitrophica bacterium]|nr:lipopolysaccharide heptosyltransferase II [Candidatus Omnitrophota bacterium]